MGQLDVGQPVVQLCAGSASSGAFFVTAVTAEGGLSVSECVVGPAGRVVGRQWAHVQPGAGVLCASIESSDSEGAL